MSGQLEMAVIPGMTATVMATLQVSTPYPSALSALLDFERATTRIVRPQWL